MKSPTNYYPGNEYHTPADHPVSLGDYLLLRSRWYFYLRIFRVMWKSMNQAKRGEFDEPVWVERSHDMIRAAEDVGVKVHISGLNNLSKEEGPVVIIGNHMSSFETFAMASLVIPHKHLCFVVKKSLLHYPIFSHSVRARDPIPVGRANPQEDFRTVMNLGREYLDAGRSIAIFPQATRMLQFDPSRFNTIGVKLARRAKVPIIPVAVKTDFWSPGMIVRDIGPIRRRRDAFFRFGNPIKVQGGGRETHQQIIDFIKDNLGKWKNN